MLHMRVVTRLNPKSSHHTEKILLCYFFNFISIWDDECSLHLLWSSFHDISQTIMLYTLNSYSTQSLSCVRLCDPMDRSPPDSSVHGISQARILEWVAMPCSGGFSRQRDWIHISCISCIGRRILYHCSTWEAPTLIPCCISIIAQ